MKTEDVLGEDPFGFRRGNGTRDSNGMLNIRMNFRNRQGIVCMLHRLAEGI